MPIMGMGFRTWMSRTTAKLFAPLTRLTLDSTPRPIDQVIFEMNSLSGRTVSRASALTVPGIVKGRNMICSISTLPLIAVDEENEPKKLPLLQQIDPDVANVVTLAQTLEDLLFDAIAWWEIIAQDAAGYPTYAQRRDPSTVSLQPPAGYKSPAPLPSGHDPRGASVWIDGREVTADKVIRFDSPNPGILTAGAKAIRQWLLLDAASSLYAEDPRPLDYFSPADDADDVDDDEVQVIIARWRAARRKRSTGWIPRSLKYNTVDAPTPQQLQLAELKREVRLELANLLGVDPEDLGVSTTSRTYSNAVDRRRDRINDVLSPYMRAITDRLSMGDVTRRGVRTIFQLSDYLKSNPTEQASVHKTYKDMGAVTVDEIRQDIGRPPMAPEVVAEAERIAREAAAAARIPQQTPPGEPVDPAEEGQQTVSNSRRTALGFDATGTATSLQRVEFSAVRTEFRVERESRTIWGMALPYGQIVEKYGLKFRFMPGSVEWDGDQVSRHKMLQDHDFDKPLGHALSLSQSREGVVGKYKLGRGQLADDALMSAEDGVRDGLSMTVEFDLEQDALWNRADGVYDVYRAYSPETSLTAMPAFNTARVTKVAASQNQGGSAMRCAACGQEHAPGVACATRPQNTPPAAAPENQPAAQPAGLQLSDDQLRQLMANPAAVAAIVGVPATNQSQQSQQPQGFTLSADQLSALSERGLLRTLLGIGTPTVPAGTVQGAAGDGEGRQVVNPGRPVAVTATREEAPYRFDRKGNLTKAKFDFSTDIIAGLRDGQAEPLQRAQQFVQSWFEEQRERQTNSVSAQFVNQADAASLNPAIQRPDLYVDQKDFEYPIWGAIEKGTINDATPFVLPKFSSSSGLVGAHVENTEPTPGTFVATSQTITPSPVSGKVEISREAWDQGGNPQLSGLIWNQMVRAWYESLEAAAVTLLEALAPTTITITTAAADSALEASLTSQLAPLQYVRGGFRMRDFFIQIDLYKALIAAKDTAGRKLFPVLGAQNATGTTADFFSALMVAGLVGRPAWALAATSANSANSYLFDRADVSGWATAPQRLTMENISVAKVHLGIWGYKALACTDLTGVRRLAYDPV